MAVGAGALWCVMPCCILADLYLPECTVSRLSDDARYAISRRLRKTVNPAYAKPGTQNTKS
jgi:hypothetical protein